MTAIIWMYFYSFIHSHGERHLGFSHFWILYPQCLRTSKVLCCFCPKLEHSYFTCNVRFSDCLQWLHYGQEHNRIFFNSHQQICLPAPDLLSSSALGMCYLTQPLDTPACWQKVSHQPCSCPENRKQVFMNQVLVFRLTSPVTSHVNGTYPQHDAWEGHFSLSIFPQSLLHQSNQERPKLRDSLQNAWPVLFKTVKKNKDQETVTGPEESQKTWRQNLPWPPGLDPRTEKGYEQKTWQDLH